MAHAHTHTRITREKTYSSTRNLFKNLPIHKKIAIFGFREAEGETKVKRIGARMYFLYFPPGTVSYAQSDNITHPETHTHTRAETMDIWVKHYRRMVKTVYCS